MMIIKRKQLIIAACAMLLFVAGILQIAFGGKDQTTSTSNSEPEIVQNNQFDPTSSIVYDDVVSDSKSSEESVETNAETQVSTNSLENLFAYEKTERISLRQDRQETLSKITEDTSADEESKALAYKSIIDLAAITEKEQAIENLVMSCGYDDCIIYFFDDGTIDVYVATTTMSGVEATKIADLVARNAGTSLDKVYVKSKF